MSYYLSEDNINYVEQELLSDKLVEGDYYPSISYSDYENAEIMWYKINSNDLPNTSYLQFASNAFGCVSYGFYKAKNGNIYIIQAYINQISRIYIPSENIDCLKNVFNNNKVIYGC